MIGCAECIEDTGHLILIKHFGILVVLQDK